MNDDVVKNREHGVTGQIRQARYTQLGTSMRLRSDEVEGDTVITRTRGHIRHYEARTSHARTLPFPAF